MTKMKTFFKNVVAVAKSIEWTKIPVATYVRYVTTALVVINQILVFTGHAVIDYDEDAIYSVFSLVLTTAVVGINTWKNNPATRAALCANDLMNKLKSMTPEEAKKVMLSINLVLDPGDAEDSEEVAETETVDETSMDE